MGVGMVIVLYGRGFTVWTVAEHPRRNFLSSEEKFVDIQLWNDKSYDDCCSFSSLHRNECEDDRHQSSPEYPDAT
jgi:hypothetical protein